MAATILARGDVLGGYKIEDIIGVGGMAIVYQAEQLSLGRQVALKVIAPQLSANPGFRERFRREGKHIAGLDHPNVVTVFDSGEVDGRLFLAMRLIDGTTLADRMHGEGISADETIAMLAPIAGALDTAHGLGLVHRDVKPQNILITDAGHPYLADFGVAKTPSSTAGLTNTGAFVGSVNYASPEQIRGEQVSSAGDIYALTAVLYQCLTGQVPFPRDTDAGVMHAHLHEPPPRLPLDGDHGERLDRVIQRGMAKEWTERYASAVEVTADAGSVISQLEPGKRLIRPAFGVVVNTGTGGAAVDGLVGAPVPADTTVAPSEYAINPAGATVAPLDGGAAGLELDAAATGEAIQSPDAPVLEGPVADGTEIIDVPTEPALPGVGAATSADVRRPAAPQPSAPAEATGRRKLPALAVIGGLVILAGGGGATALALSGGSSTAHVASATLKSGPISLAYRAPWRLASANSLLGSAFTAPAAISNGSSELTAGGFRTSAPIPGGLPALLRSAYGAPAETTTVTFAGVKGRSYSWTAAGSAVTALVMAGRTGDFGLICRAGTTARLAGCVALAERASLDDAELIAPGAPTAAVSALAAALKPVRATRSEIRSMTGRKLVARAAAASRVAALDRRAALEVRRAPVLARNAALARRLASALETEAGLYTQLATAAHENKRARYTALRPRLIQQSAKVTAAVGDLRLAGITLAAPATAALPALPALPKPVVHTAAPVSSAPAVTDTPTYTPTQTYTPAASSPAPASSSSSSSHTSSSSSSSSGAAPSHSGLPSTANLGD